MALSLLSAVSFTALPSAKTELNLNLPQPQPLSLPSCGF